MRTWISKYPELNLMWLGPFLTLALTIWVAVFVAWFFSRLLSLESTPLDQDFTPVLVIVALMGIASLSGIFLSVRFVLRFLKVVNSISSQPSAPPRVGTAELACRRSANGLAIKALVIEGRSRGIFTVWGFRDWANRQDDETKMRLNGLITEFWEGVHLVEGEGVRIWFRNTPTRAAGSSGYTDP